MNLLLILFLLCGAAAVAEAADQQQEDPKRAVFGQTPETNRPLSLIDVSVLAGSGTSLAGDGVDEDTSVTGKYYSGVGASLSHLRRMRGRTFSAALGTSVWYFPTRQSLQTIDRSARVGFDVDVGRSSRVQLSQTLLYTPFRQFGGIIPDATISAAAPPTANPDTAGAVGIGSYDLGTAAGITHDLSQRISLDAGFTSRWSQADTERLMMRRVGGGVRVLLARDAAIVVGTARQFGRSSLRPVSTTTQDFALGLDYNRPLSFSRTTTMSFRTGAALVSRSGTTDNPTELGRRLLAIGTVSLNRTFGRDWSARLSYDRSVRYIQGFPDPFTSDAFVGRVGVKVGRRFNAGVQVDYSKGRALDAMPGAAAQTFRGLVTQARLTQDLSPRWQLYAEHHYSENHLSAAAMTSLAPGLVPRRFSRGIRVGLRLWSPHVH